MPACDGSVPAAGDDLTKLPCQECKDYNKCPYGAGKEWYFYAEIRWCPYQVVWILLNALLLGEGKWPPDPEGSGYVDPMIKTGYKAEAYFTKPVETLAEVEWRLDRTGVDGKLFRAQVESGKSIGELEPEARSALMYVKGKRSKRIGYKRWLREIYYAPKTGKKHQFNVPT